MVALTDQVDSKGHDQAILDELVELVRSSGFFEGFSIYIIPRYQETTMTPPFIFAFNRSREDSDLSIGPSYKYELTISLVICLPQQDIQSENRGVHQYVEKLENLIFRNRQPTITARSDIRMQQWRITAVVFEDSPEGMEGLDTADVTIIASYDRTLTGV